MTKLYEDNDSFDFISLKRLAKSYYIENDTERIALAGFQRGAAWKAVNVEALWDSLLRWFPIGSILLARATEFSEVKVRPPQPSQSAISTKISKEDATEGLYILIDGQQRSNAIALGFLLWNHPKSSEAGARLWIDLGEPVDRKNKLFEFYLCTSDDPFGEGISVGQKQHALEIIDKSGKDDSEISLNESYPVKAKLPVPFAEFVQAIGDGNDLQNIRTSLLQDNTLNLSQKTLDFMKERFTKASLRTDLQDLLTAVREVVLDEKYKIPAILFQNRDGRVSSMQLYKLFERINISGVTPPQAEMFFSVLKLTWPEIGDYVAEISKNNDLKGLFRPTEIILAVLRLVKPEFTELTLSSFEKITEAHQHALRDLLEHEADSESIFLYCMRLAYHALHYRGNGDYGLPRQLIYRLRKRVWHTILYWIYVHRDEIKEDVSDSDRFNMVRFALLDAMDYFIFTGWWRGYSQYVNNGMFYKLLIDAISDSGDFSARNIFHKVIERSAKDVSFFSTTALKIYTPKEYKDWISPDNEENKLNWRSHSAGHVFLLYAQRDYLEKWESLNDLDKDHIIPYNWMNFSGPVGTKKFWKVDTIGPEGRSPVINSPGNFRYWPSSLNRQYKDKPPRGKFIQSELSTMLSPDHLERYINTVGDVLEASFIDKESLDKIKSIEDLKNNSPDLDSRIWTQDQYTLFKKLVDERCNKMYEHLYKSMKLYELD